jgi:hypothetical protein
MSQDKVKGVLLMDFARIIHANKDLPWDKYLTREDMGLIQGRIMPSTWYPFEAFERIGYAVFKLVGKGDLKNARAFGAFTIQETYHKVYENVLFQEKDPTALLKKFVILRKQFIRFQDTDFDPLKMELLEDNKVKMIIKASEPSEYIEPYANRLAGSFEKLLEMAGAKDIQVKILKVQSKTEPASEIELTWSNPEA